MSSLPRSVVISGATGCYMGRINGIFDATGDLVNNLPSYKKSDDKDCFIIYDAARGKWKIRCTDLNGKTIGKFYNKPGKPLHEVIDDIDVSKASSSPLEITWLVKDGLRVEKYVQSKEIRLALA